MPKTREELTKNEQLFVKEYMIDRNATAAYQRAFPGYQGKNAAKLAYQILRRPHVQEVIDKEVGNLSDKLGITAEKVLKEIASIAFDDISNYLEFYTDVDGQIRVVVKDSTTIDTKNISEVSVGKGGQFKFKTYCRDEALYKLGNHLKLFTDKQDIDLNIKEMPEIIIKRSD